MNTWRSICIDSIPVVYWRDLADLEDLPEPGSQQYAIKCCEVEKDKEMMKSIERAKGSC